MRAPNTSARSTHAGQGRVVVNSNTHAVDDETKIEAVFATRALWDLAAMVPPQATGAPRKLHPMIYCSMFGLQAIFGSFRKAETNLRKVTTRDGTGLWDRLCDYAGTYQAQFRPDEEPIDVAALKRRRPLTAQNFYDARRTFLAPYMDQIEDLFETAADEAAREIGYADQKGEGSINNLIRERTATGDGKVVRALGTRYRLLTFEEPRTLQKKVKGAANRTDFVVDTTTGELISKDDMIGEELYMTGGGLKIGYKINAISMRDDHANSTVVLRLRMQRTTYEAQELTEAAVDVKAKHPGVLGFIMDGALTGTHHRQLMRCGIVPISPIKAESISADGKRTEKTGLIQSVRHTHPHGFECRHDFHYHGGQFGEYAIADNGESDFVPLGAPKIQHRPGKARDRMYAAFTPTCRIGLADNEPSIELSELRFDVAQDAPGKGGLDYAENVRLVPPGSDVYRRTYGWRENSENDNRQRDDEKWGARARSRTVQRQHWNEVGAALLQNGIALLLHRHRVATGKVNEVKRHGHSRRERAEQEQAQLAHLVAA